VADDTVAEEQESIVYHNLTRCFNRFLTEISFCRIKVCIQVFWHLSEAIKEECLKYG